MNQIKNKATPPRPWQWVAAALVAAPFVFMPTQALSADDANYPSKAVRMVVPFGPGTTTDTISRLVAEKMSQELGESIVIDNRAGAGGTSPKALRMPPALACVSATS